MSDLVTDLKTLQDETLKNLKSSKAINTVRAYKSDFKDFGAFCAKNGLNSMPTEPKILSIYLTHLASSSKFSTLKRRIASISVIHKMKGHYLDTKHPIIMGANIHHTTKSHRPKIDVLGFFCNAWYLKGILPPKCGQDWHTNLCQLNLGIGWPVNFLI